MCRERERATRPSALKVVALRRLALGLAGLVAVIGAMACGSARGETHLAAKTCHAAGPITGRMVVAALRRHGFTARVVSGCASGKATVANAGPTAQGAELHRAEHEGLVICAASIRPVGPMARDPRRIFEYDHLPTRAYPGRELYLANVDCDLYLDSSPRANAVPELRAAMRDLRSRLP